MGGRTGGQGGGLAAGPRRAPLGGGPRRRGGRRTERSLPVPLGGPPRWVHGDLEGNCLVDATGRLCGLVDWGSACAGDPAVDIQVVWSTLFTEESRARFLAMLDVEEATLARARGAAVQQACAALPYYLDSYPEIVRRSVHKLRNLGVEVAIGSV